VAFDWVPRRFPKIHPTSVAMGALTVVAALWAVQIVRTVPHWRDNDTMFDYALRVAPNAAPVHVTHGVVLQLRDRNLNGAAREFEMALKLNAQSLQPITAVDYDSYIGLGQIALNQGREADALSYLNRAVHLLPHFGFAYVVLGSVYFPRGDYARAADYFRQAVSANPLDTNARFYFGTCLVKLAQPAQAAEQFHAARDVDPDYLQAYVAEAAAREAAGDKAGAARVRSEIPLQ
jgi:hypothetical protein